ncbi:MAG: hypothetical protein KKB21_02400 [Nanoarchaeota archaeon]|nr:hypothetical protein [Nanoarchaeota archaeon]MBU4086407.1 hypothetical protein [Nanoarchaeota archaeon]
MAVPKQRDRIKHFKKVQKYQEIFGKRDEEKTEISEEEKKAKEDKILAILNLKKKSE